MRYKILSIIAILAITGCASGSQSQAPKTPAEIEQAAQTARYNGDFEKSTVLYRQLIDNHPTHFSSLEYQHQILENALAQSEKRLLLVETLHTLMLFEKAENGHLEGATPEAIAQEKEFLGQFIYNAAYSYAQIIQTNPDELTVWTCDFLINIYNFYFKNVFIPEDIMHFFEDVNYYVNQYRSNDNNMKKNIAYDLQIFDLYERGIITDDNMTPLDLVQIDIQEHKKTESDAILDYTRAISNYIISDHQFKNIDITINKLSHNAFYIAHKMNLSCRRQLYRNNKDRSPANPIPECSQTLIRVSEHIHKWFTPEDRADLTFAIAEIYYNYYHREQALNLYWKVIEDYQNSEQKSENFASTVKESISGIFYIYYYKKEENKEKGEQSDASSRDILKLQNLKWSDDPATNAEFLITIAKYFRRLHYDEQAMDLFWRIIDSYQNAEHNSSNFSRYAGNAANNILNLYTKININDDGDYYDYNNNDKPEQDKLSKDEQDKLLNAAIPKFNQCAQWSEHPENDAKYMITLADAYKGHHYKEQALDLYWKIIDGYQNSEHNSKNFAQYAADAARNILYIQHSERQYNKKGKGKQDDKMSKTIQRINQTAQWYDDPDIDANYIYELAEAYNDYDFEGTYAEHAINLYWKIIDGYHNSDHKSSNFYRYTKDAVFRILYILYNKSKQNKNKQDNKLKTTIQRLNQTTQWSDNPENNIDYTYDLAKIYHSYSFDGMYDEQAINLYWKIIDGYQNSDHKSEKFAKFAGYAAKRILSILNQNELGQNKQDNKLETTIQKFNQTVQWSDHPENDVIYIKALANIYKEHDNTEQAINLYWIIIDGYQNSDHKSEGFAKSAIDSAAQILYLLYDDNAQKLGTTIQKLKQNTWLFKDLSSDQPSEQFSRDINILQELMDALDKFLTQCTKSGDLKQRKKSKECAEQAGDIRPLFKRFSIYYY